LFARFAEAEALAIHLEDVAAVREAIQERRGHALALEDLAPFAERKVAGDQNAAAFVAVGEDLEEQFGPAADDLLLQGPARDLLSNEALTLLVSQMQSLPSLPSLYMELMAQLESPDPSSAKIATIIALLRRPKGASLDELTKATGWQRHSVRGAISGSLKKKLGLKVSSEKTGAIRSYRITDKHAGYPPAIVQLKDEGVLEENCQHRPVQYLNNVLEQDHRAIKRRD
jgi:hypothetical protein